MKKSVRKNPHAVALGRLGGAVRSEAKQLANQENGRKGGLAKSPAKDARLSTQCAASPSWSPQEIKAVIALIRGRFGYFAIGLGEAGIRYGRNRSCARA